VRLSMQIGYAGGFAESVADGRITS